MRGRGAMRHGGSTMFEQLRDAILGFLVQYEIPALFLLVFVEEMGVPLPLPSDALIAYAGARNGRDPLRAAMVIGTVSLAAALGSSVLYIVSRKGGPTVVRVLSKVLHLKKERIVRMEQWFRKGGAAAIIIGRLIPGLRIPITVMAGLVGVPYRVFVPSTFAAAIIWAVVLFFAGDALGRLWQPIAGVIGAEPGRLFGLVVILAGVAALLFSLPPRWRVPPFLTRRRRGAAPVPPRDEATTEQ